MSRPGKKITRKTITMTNRMKELELKERSSKSLLANVLDIEDDFRSQTNFSLRPGLATDDSGGSSSVTCISAQRELQSILRYLFMRFHYINIKVSLRI